MLESRIEARLDREVRRLGGRTLKWVSPGNAGVPDRIVVMPQGEIYFVETKQAGGLPRQLQLAQHQRLRSLGCRVYTLAGLDDVKMFREILISDKQSAGRGENDEI